MNQAIVKKQQMKYFSVFILIVACILFRIQVGDTGIGYMFSVLAVYETIWVIFGARFSDVSGRIIRNRYSKGKPKLARAVWKNSFTIQLLTGLFVSVLLIVLGTVILSKGFGFVHSYYLIWFLAPTIFIRMISEAFCGFLYGRNYDAVAGFSFIIRQVIILVMGVVLSMAVKEYGIKVAALLKQEDFASIYGNIGILISAFVAEIVVLVFLMIARLNIKHHINDYEDEYYRRSESNINVFTTVWQKRTLENLNLILFLAPVFIFLILLFHKIGSETEFAENIGFTVSAVLAPCSLFVSLGFVLVLPILGKFSIFIKKREMRYARNSFQSGIHFCFILGLAAAAFFFSLGKNLSAIISAERASEMTLMYIYGALSIVFGLTCFYMIKALCLLGFGLFAALVQVMCSVIYGLVFNAMLNSGLNIFYASMLSILVYFFIISVILIIFALIRLDMVLNPISDAVIPLFCASLSGFAGFLLAKLMSPHLGNIFTCIVCFIVIMFLYLVLLMFFRNINEKDLEFFPGKKFLLSFGQMLHIF